MTVQPDMRAMGPQARNVDGGFAVGFADLPECRLTRLDPDYFGYLDQIGAVLVEHGLTPCSSRSSTASAGRVSTAATGRGQVRADLNAESVVDQLWGACYHRLLLPDQPLDEAFADTLTNLFHGIGSSGR